MANTELPYFRFTVSAWQNGKIDIERNELKGIFISICGFYWLQDCSVTLDLIQKKFPNDINLIKELIDLGIILHEKRHNKLQIEFLNKQFDLLSEKRKLRQAAGSRGGNAKAMLKQKRSYKDKDNNKDKDKDKKEDYDFLNPDFVEIFFSWMTYKIKRKEKYKSIESEKLFYDKLLALSNGNPVMAKEIIKQSMANNWAGIFELKESHTKKNYDTHGNSTAVIGSKKAFGSL